MRSLKWKGILRRAALACLLLSILTACAAAEGIDVSRSVEFGVRYEAEDAPMADVSFALYRVADVSEAGQFALAGQFAHCPVDLSNLTADGLRDLAQTLSGYVDMGGYTPDTVVKTDGEGNASFGEVPVGLYLVMGETVKRGEKRYRPGTVAVTLPGRDVDGRWNYVVTLLAKQDVIPLTHVRVVKRWDDAGAQNMRPESITVALLGNGQVVETQELTAADGWQCEWTDLDANVEWNVVESPALDNYRVIVSGDQGEFTLTNIYQPTPAPTATPEPTPTPGPRTGFAGEKRWIDDDNAAGVRPETIELILYANGAATDIAPTWGDRSGNTWAYAFQNLPMLDDAGNEIVYTVSETPVEYYATTQVGATIINRLIPQPPREYIDVSGAKTWRNDSEDQRPDSVTVYLLRDGQVVEERTVTAASGWTYSFAHLPTDDGFGHDYTYDISEKMVSGYYTLKSGYDLTNVRVPDIPEEPDEPRKSRTPRIPPLTEEELEELIDIFDYGVPLWGGLLGTGDEMPAYPFVFAGIGVAAVAVLLAFGKKRKKKGA